MPDLTFYPILEDTFVDGLLSGEEEEVITDEEYNNAREDDLINRLERYYIEHRPFEDKKYSCGICGVLGVHNSKRCPFRDDPLINAPAIRKYVKRQQGQRLHRLLKKRDRGRRRAVYTCRVCGAKGHTASVCSKLHRTLCKEEHVKEGDKERKEYKDFVESLSGVVRN